MAILVDKKTRVLIQGITGKEGLRALEGMKNYGTKVLAGVTPGKSGQKANGVPVYDTVAEALRRHPSTNASLVVVPAVAVKDAALEAMHSGILFLNILTEHVPVGDAATIFAWAKRYDARVVGPSSVGIISPGRGKIGSIGGNKPEKIFRPGPVGIISKSGGMTAEIAITLNRAGIGQSTVLGIGGDKIIGSDFVDIMKLFKNDPGTRAVVVFGEVGGSYEEQLAEFVKKEKFRKPIVAMVAGKFTTKLSLGTVLGHAGAIVMKGVGGHESKIRALRRAGISVVNTLEEIPVLLKKKLRGKIRL